VTVGDDVKQLLSLTVLRDDVLELWLFEDLVYLEDAGVILRGESVTCVGEGIPVS
jgi:hypothetical protein